MAFDINQFKSAARRGGARTSLFEVRLTNPINGIADLDFPFFCKAAPLPPANITKLELHYFGRAVPVAGNRTYDDWTITIVNDEDFKIRNAMEHWSNAINGFESNVRKLSGSEMQLYKSTAEIISYGQAGQELRTYKIIGLFPTVIASTEMSWENEAVQEFQVTFAYDYWVISQSQTGQFAGGT